MADTVRHQGSAPQLAGVRAESLDRLACFRVTYLAIFSFGLLYLLSIEVARGPARPPLPRRRCAQAVRVSPMDGPIIPQIQSRVSELRARLALVR